MKKLFIVAALVITAVGYARIISTVQRAVDANSSEGIRFQNRHMFADAPRNNHIYVNSNTIDYTPPYYSLLVDDKRTFIDNGANLKYFSFTEDGALCSINDNRGYIFIPAKYLPDFENAVEGQKVPYSHLCNNKNCFSQELCAVCKKIGHRLGWNLYFEGVFKVGSRRFPIFARIPSKVKNNSITK